MEATSNHHQPVTSAPRDAATLKTRGAMAWMETYEKAHPGGFAHYWRTVLHGRTDREADELAEAFWGPIAALDGIIALVNDYRRHHAGVDRDLLLGALQVVEDTVWGMKAP